MDTVLVRYCAVSVVSVVPTVFYVYSLLQCFHNNARQVHTPPGCQWGRGFTTGRLGRANRRWCGLPTALNREHALCFSLGARSSLGTAFRCLGVDSAPSVASCSGACRLGATVQRRVKHYTTLCWPGCATSVQPRSPAAALTWPVTVTWSA